MTQSSNQQQEPQKEMSRGAKRIQELRDIYDSRVDDKKSKILFFGDWGTYKSTLATTMPRPIFFYTFDPGGDKIVHIQEGVKDGSIIVDNEFQTRQMDGEGDVFNNWNNSYNKMKSEGVFDEVSTVVLDSLTTFQRAVIDGSIASNNKQKDIGRKMPIKVPHQRDYGVQQAAIEYAISDLLSLPCHVVIIAHAEETTDENDMPVFQPLITGSKLRKSLPLLFDEIYISYFRGKKAYLRLAPQGMFKARSRLYGLNKEIQEDYEISEVGAFSFSKDILLPAGYCTEDEVVTIKPFR